MTLTFEAVKRWVNEQFYSKREHISASRGATDAHRPVITDDNGKLDTSILTGSSDFLRIEDRGIFGNNAPDGPWYYNTDGYIDWPGGRGEVDIVGINHTATNTRLPFTPGTYYFGLDVLININDTTGSGTDASAEIVGIYGQANIVGGSTRAPTYVTGLNFTAFNRSNINISSATGLYCYADIAGSGDADSVVGTSTGAYMEGEGVAAYMVGVEAYIEGYGAAAHDYGAIYYAYAPYGNYVIACGLDIEDVTSATATTLYAIRTQGGQVLHQAGAAGVVPLVVQGAASQTADLTQWKNSAGTVLAWVDKDGKGYFPTVLGGSGSGGNLTLSSTSHATKGKLLFGTSAYDEVNNYLGVGTTTPDGLQVNVSVSETARSVDNVRFGVLSGTPRIILEDSGSTQWEIDNSAGSFRLFNPGAVKFTLDTSGNLVISGTIKTANGDAWDLRDYTTSAPAATGYVTVVIDGVTYKLLASNV